MAALAAACSSALAADPVTPGQPVSLTEAPAMVDPASEANALPMTKTVITRGALDKENPQDGYEALKSVAGVTSASAKGTISDNLNIRGIQLDTYSSYRINGGVSLVNIIAIPSENKERIEALKGANALMFGIASPAGIVNLVTKRATSQDVSTASLSANIFGQYGASVIWAAASVMANKSDCASTLLPPIWKRASMAARATASSAVWRRTGTSPSSSA